MLLVICFIILCGHVTRSEDDNPSVLTVEIDNFEISTEYDHKYVNWDTLGLKKVGRNKFVMSGTLSLNRNLGDEQKITIQIYPYNKESKIKGPLIYKIEKGICNFIANDEAFYPFLKEKSNFPEPGTCPIPKNEYTIKDYNFNVDFLRDSTPKGDYLMVTLIKDGLIPVAGFTTVISIYD